MGFLLENVYLLRLHIYSVKLDSTFYKVEISHYVAILFSVCEVDLSVLYSTLGPSRSIW